MWVLDQADALYRSFQRAKAEDAKAFGREAVKILSRYPAEVISDVCENLHLELDWPPNTHELKKACDKSYGPILRQRERERILHEQAERSRKIEEERKRNAGSKKIAQHVAEMKAKEAANIIPAAPEFILSQYLAFKARHGSAVTLSPEAAAILEAAGIDWRNADPPQRTGEPKPKKQIPLDEQETSLTNGWPSEGTND